MDGGDTFRRNLLNVAGNDSTTISQITMGANVLSKDSQQYLIVSLNSGGSHNDEWHFVFADVTADSTNYQSTTNNYIDHYTPIASTVGSLCYETK